MPSPKTISLPLAIAILAAILLAGGGLVFKYLYNPPRPNAIKAITPAPGQKRIAKLEPDAPSPKLMEALRESDLPDGAYPRGEDELLIKSHDAYARLGQRDGQPFLRLGFYTLSELQWDHGYLTQGVRRIQNQPDFARGIGISPSQLKQLEDLPKAPDTDWPAADRQRLLDLYARWLKSMGDPRLTIAQDLVAALGPIAQRKRADDDQAMRLRVERLRAILTPQQVQAINPIPRWEMNPASRPSDSGAARPATGPG